MGNEQSSVELLPDGNPSGEELEIIVDDADVYKPKTSDVSNEGSCCRFISKDVDLEVNPSHVPLIKTLLLQTNQKNIECTLNELRNATYFSCMGAHKGVFGDHERCNILDSFLRGRHENLATQSCSALNFEGGKTDVPFCTILPISSTRTPDYILKMGDKKVLIVEVTAVSDSEKAALSKGLVSKGYKSKYDPEINELLSIGYLVDYVPVIFDVFERDNKDHEGQLQLISRLIGRDLNQQRLYDLEVLRKEYISLTSEINSYYSDMYNHLFGKPYKIFKTSFSDEKGLFNRGPSDYSGSYKRVGISHQLYDKVTALWPRLPRMLDRLKGPDLDKCYSLTYDATLSRFKLEKDNKGSSVELWEQAIAENWRSWVCQNIKYKINSQTFQTPRSDYEFFSYEKGEDFKSKRFSNIMFFNEHTSSCDVIEGTHLDDTKFLNPTSALSDLISNYEDEDYEKKLVEGMSKSFSASSSGGLEEWLSKRKNKPLASYVVNEEAFSEAVVNYDMKQSSTADFNDWRYVHKVKQPFIYPLYKVSEMSYSSYSKKPSIIKTLIGMNFGEYTNRIIKLSNNSNFCFGTRREEVNRGDNHARIRLAELSRERGRKVKAKEITKIEARNLYGKEMSELQKVIFETSKMVDKGTKVGVIRVGSNSKNESRGFVDEMEHFKKKDVNSIYQGVGNNYDHTYVNNLFQNLINSLIMPSPTPCPDNYYDDRLAVDCPLLMELKKKSLDDCRPFSTKLKNSNIYHTSAFIARLCHTLLYTSQTTLNNDWVSVDNLGYSDVLLIIRGGKKIFPTKRSKLFRVFYPCYDEAYQLYGLGNEGSDFTHFMHEGRQMIATPWMNMNETLLVDGLTILHRLMGFVTLNRSPDMDFETNMKKSVFNMLLALHGRRKTEAVLHNLRYIMMNCMSDISAISEMLKEAAGFNYDYFQAWVRGSISKNFLCFAKEMKHMSTLGKANAMKDRLASGVLKHLVTGFDILDLESLSTAVYSTYLMSKAPTTQSLDQVANLKSMMEIHEDFNDRGGGEQDYRVTFDGDFDEYYDNLFKSDFSYDPKYCTLLGKFMADYMLNLETKAKTSQKWDQLLDKNWDEFANTKGLRYKGKDFFGNKGYYVVYKEMLTDTRFESDVQVLLGLMNSEEPEARIKKKFDNLNRSFRERICNTPLEKVVLHAVDKKQRGGNREIYVMDLETKVHQQVIEGYMAHLCKIVPNELISIPSNKRLSTIHGKVFEESRDLGEHYYWVLDCRKWAPKSLIEKFMLFLVSGKSFFPPTFVEHCLNFFKLATEKRVYTRKPILEILTKSKGCKKYESIFSTDEETGGVFFTMPYSWMMGIFNYFSSFFHVACQLHSSHVIRMVNRNIGFGESVLHMMAHSDDSAGVYQTNQPESHRTSSIIYETLMHSANHLISRKKSCKGKAYFELLSVLYLGGELMTLLDKFTGIFNFHPSDQGYCTDITECYSKCTEIFLNGGTFDQAYLAMKIQADLITSFYFQRSRSDEDYCLPPQLYGQPDAHPLMVLLLGSESDVMRLMKYGDEKKLSVCVAINEVLTVSNNESGLFKSFTMNPRVFLNEKLKSLAKRNDYFSSIKDTWVMSNVKFNNSVMNCVQFIKKLKDKSFISALQDETVVRRISRSYYGRSHETTMTKYSNMSPRAIKETIMLFVNNRTCEIKGLNEALGDIRREISTVLSETEPRIKQYKRLADMLYSEPIGLCDYMDHLTLSDKTFEEYNKTCKPTHINIMKTSRDSPVKFEVGSLLAWMKYPEYKPFLSDTRGYWTAEVFIKDMLRENEIDFDTLNDQQLFAILNKVRSKLTCEYFCYSNVPSGMRDVSTYQDVLNLIAHNSFKGEYIKGLAQRFGKTMTAPDELIMPDLSDTKFRAAISFLTILPAMLKTTQYNENLWDLEVSYPGSDDITSLKDLWDHFKSFWGPHRLGCYLKPQMLGVSAIVDGVETINTELFKDCFYHSFLRRQFLIGNVWLGLGKLLVSAGEMKMVFSIRNVSIESVVVLTNNYNFTRQQIEYINLSLKQSQLPSLAASMHTNEDKNEPGYSFGVNSEGSYMISENRFLVSKLSTTLMSNFDEPITEFNRGVLKSTKRNKYRWTCNWAGKNYSYILNTLNIESSETLHLMRGLIVDSEKNKNILSTFGVGLKNTIQNLCYNELELELNMSIDEMVKAPRMSKIYKILRHCRVRRLANVNPEWFRPTHEPSPDGGLLNCLINYSLDNPEFNFRWEHMTTPEYMQLKSAQPESFMTELSEGLSEKYSKLYDSDDKMSIMKSLYDISRTVTGEVDETRFRTIMCTWGYIGVSGALNDMELVKDAESFKSVRNLDSEDPYISVSVESFKHLVWSLYETGLENIRSGRQRSRMVKQKEPANEKQLNMMWQEVAITIANKCYMQGSYLDILDVTVTFVTNELYCILVNEEACKSFEERLKQNFFLKQLPCNPFYLNDWLAVFRTLMNTYVSAKSQPKRLNYIPLIERFEDMERPKKIAEDVLCKTNLVLPNRSNNHHGLISTYALDELLLNKKVFFRGEPYYFRFELVDFKKAESVPLTPSFPFSHPLTEDFLESDEWEEVKYELVCADPDCDEIESQITAYGSNIYAREYSKSVRVVEKGKLKSMRCADFCVILMMGCNAAPVPYSKVRNSGENLILVCNYLLVNMLKGYKNVMAFQETKPSPTGSINDECNLFYLVITNEFRDPLFWETSMGWRQVTGEMIDEMFYPQSFSENTGAGTRVNYVSEGGSEKFSWVDEFVKVDMEKENINKELGTDKKGLDTETLTDFEYKRLKVKNYTNKLKDFGMDVEQIKHYRSLVEKAEPGSKIENLLNMFLDMTTNSEGSVAIEKIKNMFNSIVKKPLTSKEQEMIFQIPLIFGGGRRRETVQKNTILRDQQVVAELEAFCPGIVWKIISGTFRISGKWAQRMDEQLSLYETQIENTAENKEGKLLVYKLLCLVLNDSKPTKEGEEDRDTLQQLIDVANKVICKKATRRGNLEFFEEDGPAGSFEYGYSGSY